MKRLNVALLYNLKQNAPHVEGEPWDRWNELDSEKTAAGIERALRAGGHEVIAMEGDKNLPKKLETYKVDKIPAIALVGAKDYGIRFYGIPAGYEFSSLMDDIVAVSKGESGLAPATKAAVAKINQPVHIQVYVTPT